MKILTDTINMMVSEDFKERFKAEYFQIRIRYIALSSMVNDWDNGKLHFKPTCPRSTYELQLLAMKSYISVLEARAVMENIDITDN